MADDRSIDDLLSSLPEASSLDSVNEWYFRKDEIVIGPGTFQTLQRWAKIGKFTTSDDVKRESDRTG